MDSTKKHLITAALPYANGPIHIGHMAGCYLPADIYVRYLRQRGRDVKFICGSDEHGVAITIKAKKEGITPQEVVDKYDGLMRSTFEKFGISFDVYSRTSSDLHKETAGEFFKDLYDKGVFTEKETEQYYDPEADQFLADRYITGTCPNCGHDHAYGDQCENCGTSLNPTDLINPKSTLSGSEPILKKTKNWFLPLDKLSPKIREYIESHQGNWKSNVYGQCKSWLDAGDGLQPRSMTRDLDWGVPVPVEGAEGKVLYVWFDAPLGYITATKELLGDDWESYWKDPNTELVHFIGKDNIVFHCIIFPSILMEHGGMVLPSQVPANEFLNLEGDKISTSRNWAVWLHEYLEDFEGQQDVLRYALCASMPETKDNDFTWKEFQTRNNSELVAILGNFVNRILVLTAKYNGQNLPANAMLLEDDLAALGQVPELVKKVEDSLEKYRFRDALSELMNIARLGNKYLADQEPWKVIKTDEARAHTILYTAAQIAAALSIVSEPFLPHTANKLKHFFNTEDKTWEDSKKGVLLPEGHPIAKAELLFSKIEDDAIAAQLEKLENTKKMNEEQNQDPSANTGENASAQALEPAKENISFEDFVKLDIRVGTITEAERVPKTDKLLKFTVDTGIDKRTILSGIAEHYAPEDCIGQQVSVLINLEPRKIRGIESCGMILLAEDTNGKLIFASPKSPVTSGSVIA
ncbi:MAG: methionine--tRNA ligase [Schleiferiaceae bacterium]